MVAALRIGRTQGVGSADMEQRLVQVLEKLALPSDITAYLSPGVATRMSIDKKRNAKNIRFVLLEKLGETRFQDIPIAELETLLATIATRST
jgi:3-dehydroquinate synthetase